MVQTFTDRICPGTFMQSFHRKGLELPGVKTRLGSESSGYLSWGWKNESQTEMGCLQFEASLPP